MFLGHPAFGGMHPVMMGGGGIHPAMMGGGGMQAVATPGGVMLVPARRVMFAPVGGAAHPMMMRGGGGGGGQGIAQINCSRCGASSLIPMPDEVVQCPRCGHSRNRRDCRHSDPNEPNRAGNNNGNGNRVAAGTYTRHGMMAQQMNMPVRPEMHNGERWYVKEWPENMAQQCVRGWERARDAGVAPPIEVLSSRSLRVKGGTVIPRFVRSATSSEKQRALTSLNELQSRLRNAGLAHTDVKPENVVIDGNGRALLIDCDFMTRFGRPRQVCTPGVNGHHGAAGCPCDEQTDQMGFDAVRSALS